MQTFADYISGVIKRKQLRQKDLIPILGVSKGAISGYVNGKNVPEDIVCKKLAELAGDPIEKVLLLAAEARTPEPTRKAWHKILTKYAKVSGFMVGLIFLILIISPTIAQANSGILLNTKSTLGVLFDSTFYPLCDKSWWWLRGVIWLLKRADLLKRALM